MGGLGWCGVEQSSVGVVFWGGAGDECRFRVRVGWNGMEGMVGQWGIDTRIR